jgi:membrane-associated protein
MAPRSFLIYNLIGAVGWVTVCVGAGALFGNVPIVKENFTLVALGIVFVSVLPMAYEVIKARRAARS